MDDEDKKLIGLFEDFSFSSSNNAVPSLKEQKEVDVVINQNGMYDELLFLLKSFSIKTKEPIYLN